jgi:hypothetical protein
MPHLMGYMLLLLTIFTAKFKFIAMYPNLWVFVERAENFSSILESERENHKIPISHTSHHGNQN